MSNPETTHDWRAGSAARRQAFADAIARHELSVTVTRDPDTTPVAKGESPTFRFSCVVSRGTRHILTTQYRMGIGHNRFPADLKVSSRYRDGLLRAATQGAGKMRYPGASWKTVDVWPTPDATDVLSSLCTDASVLDSSGFEDWASEFGYDTDSRQAESTYRACLEIALKLRAAIGDAALSELRELANEL
jgi:hypothetical protein